MIYLQGAIPFAIVGLLWLVVRLLRRTGAPALTPSEVDEREWRQYGELQAEAIAENAVHDARRDMARPDPERELRELGEAALAWRDTTRRSTTKGD